MIHQLTSLDDKNSQKRVLHNIHQAVETANQKATTNFQRKSVISGAAYLLSMAKADSQADRLLQREAAISTTPWYYYSSLSSLAKERHQHSKAIHYMLKSLEKATGSATQIQVLNSTLSLYHELRPQGYAAQLANFTNRLYLAVTATPDGFVGRNRRATAWIEKHFKDLAKAKVPFKLIHKKLAITCANQQATSKEICIKHFDKITKL